MKDSCHEIEGFWDRGNLEKKRDIKSFVTRKRRKAHTCNMQIQFSFLKVHDSSLGRKKKGKVLFFWVFVLFFLFFWYSIYIYCLYKQWPVGLVVEFPGLVGEAGVRDSRLTLAFSFEIKIEIEKKFIQKRCAGSISARN